MIESPISFGKFLVAWLPMLAASVAIEPAAPSGRFLLEFDGLQIPIVTAVLAAIGVLAARPLARKKEASLPLGQFLLVTGIMLVVVELWVIQSHPGWLFAFVVAIGLGFSGYSLIELLGDQLKELVKAAFTSAKGAVGGLIGSSETKDKEG